MDETYTLLQAANLTGRQLYCQQRQLSEPTGPDAQASTSWPSSSILVVTGAEIGPFGSDCVSANLVAWLATTQGSVSEENWPKWPPLDSKFF